MWFLLPTTGNQPTEGVSGQVGAAHRATVGCIEKKNVKKGAFFKLARKPTCKQANRDVQLERALLNGWGGPQRWPSKVLHVCSQ